jgi:hypothetical protein
MKDSTNNVSLRGAAIIARIWLLFWLLRHSVMLMRTLASYQVVTTFGGMNLIASQLLTYYKSSIKQL